MAKVQKNLHTPRPLRTRLAESRLVVPLGGLLEL